MVRHFGGGGETTAAQLRLQPVSVLVLFSYCYSHGAQFIG